MQASPASRQGKTKYSGAMGTKIFSTKKRNAGTTAIAIKPKGKATAPKKRSTALGDFRCVALMTGPI